MLLAIPLASRYILIRQDMVEHERVVHDCRNVNARLARPFFKQAGIMLTCTPGGSLLPTLGERAYGAEKGIVNVLHDPDIVVVPASWSNIPLFVSGPIATGPGLAGGIIHSVAQKCATATSEKKDAVLRHNEETSCDCTTTVVECHVDPGVAQKPAMNSVELSLRGTFFPGKVFATGSNVFACTSLSTQGESSVTIGARVVIADRDKVRMSTKDFVLYAPSGPFSLTIAPFSWIEGSGSKNTGIFGNHMRVEALGHHALELTKENGVGIIESHVVLHGSYASTWGIKSVQAVLDGEAWALEANSLTASHGTYALALHEPLPQGVHDVKLVMEDLVENVITSKSARFYFLSSPLGLHGEPRRRGTDMVLDARITGLGRDGRLPMLTSFQVNGDDAIPQLRFDDAGAVLHEWRQRGHNGYNLFMMDARLSIMSTGMPDVKLLASCELYANGIDTNALPDLPHIGDHFPARKVLDCDNGVRVFDNKHPFEVAYFGCDPGVDTNKVHILVRTVTGEWQDISDKFRLGPTRAVLRSEGTFCMYATQPQIKVLVPELGCPIPSEAIVEYRLLDSSQAKQPYILSVSPPRLTQGKTQSLMIEGLNLSTVAHEVILGGPDPGSYRLRLRSETPEVNGKASMQVIREYPGEKETNDVLHVSVNPPQAGAAFLYLGGVKQEYFPISIEAPQEQKRHDGDRTHEHGDGRQLGKELSRVQGRTGNSR